MVEIRLEDKSRSTDFLIKEIKVTGSFKNWTDPKLTNNGVSGGSEFELTAIPANKDFWFPEEAQVVAFDLRMQIHTILMADAQNRGVPLPADAQTTLIRYREKVEGLKNGLGERLAWKDADIPPPCSEAPVASESVEIPS